MIDKIVYVVTEGDYSDYSICGVFDNEADAVYVAEKYDGRVEPYSINPTVRELRKGYTGYIVRMARDGMVHSVEEWEYFIDTKKEETVFYRKASWTRTPWMATHMYARDTKHAVKIANERRVQAIAENRWPGQGKHFKAEG